MGAKQLQPAPPGSKQLQPLPPPPPFDSREYEYQMAEDRIQKAIAVEREACAKVVDEKNRWAAPSEAIRVRKIAELIRARGKTKQ